MAVPVPQECMQQLDRALSMELLAEDADAGVPVGRMSSDRRSMVWVPTMCCQPERHRFIREVKTVSAAYRERIYDKHHSMACRMCKDEEVAWPEKKPSAAEVHAYAEVQKVFGPECIYIYEWEPFEGCRKSVDVMVVQMQPFIAWAVHVDGRHHVHTHQADDEFDKRLLRETWCSYIVRLRDCDQPQWPRTLQDARRGGRRTRYYSWV